MSTHAPLWRFATLLLLLLTSCVHREGTTGSSSSSRRAHLPGTLLDGVHRVVFLGDSITYSGQFIDDLEAVLQQRPGSAGLEFINLGLPSETVSGLSEPGHAGGTFPRPDVHERLERVLTQTHPDLVIACYGMNDGIYYPLGDERFRAFQDGMRRLHERVLKSGARIIHVTPPVFDPMPIKGSTLPAGRAEYRQPYVGYNDVLDRYSEWLMAQRAQGWIVIDVHTPMNVYLGDRRQEDPKFTLASDGVHAGDTGHWLMAQVILHGLKVRPLATKATVNYQGASSGGEGILSGFGKDATGALSFTWQTVPPMPLIGFPLHTTNVTGYASIPSQGQTHRLIVQKLPTSSCELQSGDLRFGVFTREALARGIDTRRLKGLPSNAVSAELLKVIHVRNHLISDAWLTATGHKRPGMGKGKPLAEAEAEAIGLNAQIAKLSTAVSIPFRLVPVPETP